MTHDWHTLCAGIRCAGEVLPMAAVACVMALDEYMQWCTIISQTQTADHGVSQSFRNVFFFFTICSSMKKKQNKRIWILIKFFVIAYINSRTVVFIKLGFPILMAGFEHFDWFLGQYKPQTWPKKSRDSSLTWKGLFLSSFCSLVSSTITHVGFWAKSGESKFWWPKKHVKQHSDFDSHVLYSGWSVAC